MAAGRPTKYNAEIAKIICERVAISCENLKVICSKYNDMPTPETIRVWRWNKPEFSALYAQAKMFQAEMMAEDILAISDDASHDAVLGKDGEKHCNNEFVQRSRLRVDTRKWLACKLAPKIYGDKQIIEQTTTENEQLKAELAELRAKLDEKAKAEY